MWSGTHLEWTADGVYLAYIVNKMCYLGTHVQQTEKALVKVVNDLLVAPDKVCTPLLLLFDLCAPFETIDSSRQIRKAY